MCKTQRCSSKCIFTLLFYYFIIQVFLNKNVDILNLEKNTTFYRELIRNNDWVMRILLCMKRLNLIS